MIRKSYKLICLCLFSATITWANDDTKLTKTITRSFQLDPGDHLTVLNKYGSVELNTWDHDSVYLEIEITAYGKNDKTVNKVMDRVDFDFDQNNRYLRVATVLDRSSGFFTELWNNIGDYSKTLLSQNQLKIEYVIFLPEMATVVVANKFGDVYVEDFGGNLSIELSHGNIRGGHLTGETELNFSFGNLNIKSIENGDLEIKAVDAEFDSLGDVDMTSSSSEIFIGWASRLKLNSRSDRRLQIDGANDVSGTSYFSKVEVEAMTGDLDLDISYGELLMQSISPGFARINLQTKAADIKLYFAQGNYLDFEYQGNADKIFFSRYEENLESTYIDDSRKVVKLGGYLGEQPNPSPGKVTVKTESGEVNISID